MSLWLCSILAALNLVSYIAQLFNPQGKRRQTDTPLFYLAFNILSAAEQMNLCLRYSEDIGKKSQSYGDHFAQRSRQWMTLCHLAAVWMMFSFVQFLTSVCCSSRSFRRKSSLAALCVLYALFLLIPLAFGNFRSTIAETVTADFPHLLPYINPAVIYIGLYAFSRRVRPMSAVSTSSLSLAGLASQAIVHGVLTISWALMVRPRWEQISTFLWPALVLSYNFFWWPLVDNAIFALLQGRLLLIALKEKKAISIEDDSVR